MPPPLTTVAEAYEDIPEEVVFEESPLLLRIRELLMDHYIVWDECVSNHLLFVRNKDALAYIIH